MATTMRISVSMEDENGNVIIAKSSERSVPYIDEVEEQGFRAAFHDLETAILECDSIVSEYLAITPQKKQEVNRTLEK